MSFFLVQINLVISNLHELSARWDSAWATKEKLFTPLYLYTFQEEKLDAIIGEENTHRCRIHPHEAAIYSLRAKGKHLDRFSSISKAVLTVEVDEKKEDSSVEIPVNFSKEDVAKVKIFSFCTILRICIDFNKKSMQCQIY